MSRRARTRTSLLGFGLVLLGFPLWWSARHVSGSDAAHGGFVVPADFQTTLIRASLDPSALAASGVSSGSVVVVLQAAADTINANPTALPVADAGIASARPDVDRLAAKIQSGLAAQEDFAAYQAAASALSTATTQRQTALNNIFNAAVANQPAQQRNTLTQVRANRAQEMSASHPIEFLVIERSQTDWVNLRDCLANEHIAIKHPETLDQVAQANLATWRADPAVSTARNSLGTSLPAVTSAWNAAAGVQ